MKISIVVISKGNSDAILATHASIVSQTSRDFEYLIVECGKNSYSKELTDVHQLLSIDEDVSFYKACNKAIEVAKGDYCLFLRAGDCLTNDRVVEEISLNSLNTDIVFANTIVKNEVNDTVNNEEHLFIADNIKASDLILKALPLQAALFKRTLFSELHPFDERFLLSSGRLLVLEALLVNQKSYKHINLFLSTIQVCEDDSAEIPKGLAELIPFYAADYAALGVFSKDATQERMKVLNKFGQSPFFKLIWAARQWAEKKGVYDLKAKLKQQKYYKKLAKADAQKRVEVAQQIQLMPDNILKRNNDATDIIVSLTSFGKRVEDSAPYAIYTLFTQKRLPNRIILFLDNDNWNEGNIPPLLRKLQLSGLEIMFCEDIKPYKKLIPALQLFPENAIITVDDDVYYNDATLSELLDAYDNSDKQTIICHWAFIAEKRNGKFIPYSQWKDNKFWNYESFFSPVGQDGVLYPARIFDEEMIKSDIFMKLCTNDDVWFWIQEYRNKVNIELVRNSSKHKSLFVNTVDQWAPTKKSALYYLNVIEGRNDINLRNLLEYYKIE